MKSLNSSIGVFISHCKFEKNLSIKSQKAYATDLTQFKKFLFEKGLPTEISTISKNEIRGFLESISLLKPKSIKRKIATIRAFFNFLEFEDQIAINPLRKMHIKIKEEHRLPTVMDLKEVSKILKSAYETRAKENSSIYKKGEVVRNIIIIELLFATGARVSELANLRLENIDINSGVVIIKGKGNKERIIQICNRETLNILKTYALIYKDRILSSGGYFFINRFGNRLTDQSFRAIVKMLSIQAGIKKNITPHVFRHSFATLLLEKDVDIKYIQTLLGHSSIMTTQIYTHVSKKKQRQILSLKHPRRDISMVLEAS